MAHFLPEYSEHSRARLAVESDARGTVWVQVSEASPQWEPGVVPEWAEVVPQWAEAVPEWAEAWAQLEQRGQHS